MLVSKGSRSFHTGQTTRIARNRINGKPSVRLVSLPERDTVIAAPCTRFITSTVANRSELSTLSSQYALTESWMRPEEITRILYGQV